MLLGVLVGVALEVSAAASPSNPLAIAEKGQLQCYRPDVQRKTCHALASYSPTGPGTYDNKALIPVSTNATLETHTPVTVRGDAVCGFIRSQDLIAGTLRVDGQVIPPEKAKPILERIAQATTSMSDKEICTRYEPAGTDFTAKISIAGTYQRDQDEAVKWVGPTEGYSVTP